MAKGKRNTKKVDSKKIMKKVEDEIDESYSLKYKIIVVLCVIIFLALFYLLAVHITNKNSSSSSSNDTKETSTTSDYSERLFGSSFNRSESEYLVIYYDKGNSDLFSELNTAVTDYSTKDDSLTIYTVDMSSMYNKAYVTEEDTNKSPSNIDELRINGPTLIKITNGEVTSYVEGTESIKEYLG